MAGTVSVEEKKMERVEVEAANKLIGVKLPVLDHGFVMLVDYMGSDASIVQAARTSYGAGTRTLRDDTGLIRYLMRHRHTTPFEMVQIKVFAAFPMSVGRQWVRHRTASINEESSRYTVMPELFYVADVNAVQKQSKTNRQGRGERFEPQEAEDIRRAMSEHAQNAHKLYGTLIERGVARELARDVLPLSTYSQWYWNTNLWNMYHFLGLRLDSHAQLEIRSYANRLLEVTRAVAPIATEAFTDFVLNSMTFSRKEMDALKLLIRDWATVEEACEKVGLQLRKADGTLIKTGEGPEFIEKLARLRG